MVELHILSCVVNVDSAWLYWHQVGAKDHLTEIIVVHVLHAGFLFGAIYVDTFVLFVNFIYDFTTDCVSVQKFVVEPMLFLVVLEHILFFSFLVLVADFSGRN